MKLLKAGVVSNTDIFQTGNFTVSSTSFTGTKACIYTSPYGGFHEPIFGNKGGFFAIPGIGQQILIAQSADDKGDVFYFISVIHANDNRTDGDAIPVISKAGPIPDEMYKSYPGSPQKLMLRDSYGNRFVLSHAFSETKNREVNRAEVIGSKGKRLSLDESPMINRISLENEYKDGFYLTSDASPASTDMGERHMILRTVGMMQHLSEFGIEMVVTEGTDLSLTNNSVGINSDGSIYGNVNLRSKYKDINLISEGSEGKVLLRSLGTDGVIQLNSDGDIIIKSPNKAIYIEGNEININAAGSLNLGGANVNINGTQSVSITGGSTSTVSLTSAEATLDGILVNLGPATPPAAATSPNSPQQYQNDYGE